MKNDIKIIDLFLVELFSCPVLGRILDCRIVVLTQWFHCFGSLRSSSECMASTCALNRLSEMNDRRNDVPTAPLSPLSPQTRTVLKVPLRW